MKPSGVQVPNWFAAYGGMILIGGIGICVLIFAGILPVNSEIRIIEQELDAANSQISSSNQIRPVEEVLRKRLDEYRQLRAAAIEPEPIRVDELDVLVALFKRDVLQGLFDVQELSMDLPSSASDDEARLQLYCLGSYEDLAPLFERLLKWPHWNGIDAVSINAKGRERELELLLRIPIQ